MVELEAHKLTWVRLEELLKQKPIALLPIGSFEQHGYHLPLATDSIVAWHIAKLVEKRDESAFVVFPPIVYACSSEHKGFTGTVWIDYVVFIEYVEGVVKSLFESGFEKVAIINAHGGNVAALSVLQRRVNLGSQKAKVYVFNLTDYRELLNKVFGRQFGVQHAGYSETSIVEAIDSSLVDYEALKRVDESDFNNSAKHVFTVKPTREVSNSGMVDNSERFLKGSVENAKRFIEKMVEEICNELKVE